MLASSVVAFGIGLALIPAASADPIETGDTDAPAPAPGPGTSAPSRFTPGSPDANPASLEACQQFSGAMNYAAQGYEEFAYASAGNGDLVNYGDAQVDNSNEIGRGALKQAAALALSASATPGLQPEISGPMQSWSLNAAKLILIMGVRGGGDALNGAATDLNNDAHKVQMACAAAGTRA